MTKIEIEKPVLPKWLDEYMKDYKSEDNALMAISNMHADVLFDVTVGKKEDNYITDNVNKILTAIMYGYEVED